MELKDWAKYRFKKGSPKELEIYLLINLALKAFKVLVYLNISQEQKKEQSKASGNHGLIATVEICPAHYLNKVWLKQKICLSSATTRSS